VLVSKNNPRYFLVCTKKNNPNVTDARRYKTPWIFNGKSSPEADQVRIDRNIPGIKKEWISFCRIVEEIEESRRIFFLQEIRILRDRKKQAK
jgi:hypothetical protein